MGVEFTATEAGFDRGIGGASNARSSETYHYLLFGQQTLRQHPEYNGIYFEVDHQNQGGVNLVTRVVVSPESVRFQLDTGDAVLVRCGVDDEQWRRFLQGIHEVFESVERLE